MNLKETLLKPFQYRSIKYIEQETKMKIEIKLNYIKFYNDECKMKNDLEIFNYK